MCSLPLRSRSGHPRPIPRTAASGAGQRRGLRNETACSVGLTLVSGKRAEDRSLTVGGVEVARSRRFCSGNGLGSARFWLVRFSCASRMRESRLASASRLAPPDEASSRVADPRSLLGQAVGPRSRARGGAHSSTGRVCVSGHAGQAERFCSGGREPSGQMPADSLDEVLGYWAVASCELRDACRRVDRDRG